MNRRVLYSGFREHHALYQAHAHVLAEPEGTVIVAGHGGKVDLLVEETAEARGLHTDIHPADWNTHGKGAGPIRNGKMLRTGVDVVEAFPTFDPRCRGTWDQIRQARAMGVPTRIHLPLEPAILIRTARLSKRAGRLLGALDISRMTGRPDGLVFAPSWAILKAAKGAQAEAQEMAAEAEKRATEKPEEAQALYDRALKHWQNAWRMYEQRFHIEMQASYRLDREYWHAFLNENQVVCLLCYCPPHNGGRPKYCHRRLVVEYLAKVGAAIGRRVVDGGEVIFA